MVKSYVTLAVCPICLEETGDLLMDMRLRDSFEMRTVTPEPCAACREKYLSDGVLLLAPATGGIVVLKDEAFERIFSQKVPAGKVALCEAGVIEKLHAARMEAEEATE
jgi:hypothetical protein